MDEKPWIDFHEVKSKVSLQAVLDHYGLTKTLKPSGQELRGKCPFHEGGGKDDFHANTKKNVFHCFSGGCRAKGNVLDFVIAMENCSTRDAALKLKDWFSLSLESKPPKDKAAPQAQDPKPEPAPEQAPGESDEPNKPLAFTLSGIDHAHPYLSERGIDPETAEYFGVGFFPGKGSMAGRVVIPIENERGELVAYAGRALNGDQPKYKLPAGFHKAQVLYNLPRALEEDSTGAVVLVEGFFDCMKVTQAEHVCVALMGCSLSQQQERQLAAHFKQVVITLDGDEAGRRAALEIAGRLARHLWVRIVALAEGKQPDMLSVPELQTLLA